MRRATDRRGERGTVMVFAALAMTALLLFAALAIDVGVVWSSRTQSQNAVDSAALAAAANLIDESVPSVTQAAARAAAKSFASQNATVGNPSVKIDTAVMEFGEWRFSGSSGTCSGESPPCLDTSVAQDDPNLITGVRVNVEMDDVNNARSPVFLSQLLGITGFEVNNTAVGYLGFRGSFTPGDFCLPVAIDSCEISTGGCGNDFCMKTASPPNPCELKYPQTGDGDVHCLEFSSTDEQNACWTALDGSSSSVNNNNLKPIVDKCNTGDVDAGDEAYLDNGDKNETLHYIRDKFYGDGHPPDGPPPGSPAGVDRYPSDEVPSRIDSWVVKLPVFECQEDDHCAGPDTFAITGGVCFEIREILSPPHDPGERLIKGRFLCPGDPLFQEFCYDPDDPPQTGTGCNFGMRASIPVLVE